MFAAIVADIFVDFIGDHEKVMLGGHAIDDFELGAGPHLAAWFAGVQMMMALLSGVIEASIAASVISNVGAWSGIN